MIDIKKLMKLAMAATGGEFSSDGNGIHIGTRCVATTHMEPKHQRIADAEFYAAANPTTIFLLLEEFDSLTAELNALKTDAERFRWITDDHQDPEVRTNLLDLFERLPVMSYSAACAAIDAAIRASKEEI